jgi:uncharacterized membrane-anchored protein YjiN (DUF445 family)
MLSELTALDIFKSLEKVFGVNIKKSEEKTNKYNAIKLRELRNYNIDQLINKMNKFINDFIKDLSIKDNKTLSQKVLKVVEEVGELAKLFYHLILHLEQCIGLVIEKNT